MSDFSFISNAHPAYIESMYVRFLENPTSIDPEWYHFFKGFEFAESSTIEKRTSGTNFSTKEFQVVALINAYRSRGHLLSTTNPIKQRRDRRPKLQIEDFNLSEKLRKSGII